MPDDRKEVAARGLDKQNPNGCWTAQERKVAFEAIVLQALWIIIKALGSNKAREWRGEAVVYLDQVGNQGEEPKAYRREVAFSE